jgi:hypothetical protein
MHGNFSWDCPFSTLFYTLLKLFIFPSVSKFLPIFPCLIPLEFSNQTFLYPGRHLTPVTFFGLLVSLCQHLNLWLLIFFLVSIFPAPLKSARFCYTVHLTLPVEPFLLPFFQRLFWKLVTSWSFPTTVNICWNYTLKFFLILHFESFRKFLSTNILMWQLFRKNSWKTENIVLFPFRLCTN